MDSIGILVIGIIAVASVAWQIRIFNNIGRSEAAMIPLVGVPAGIGGVITIGVLLYSIFLYIDDGKNFMFFDIITSTFFALVFAIILTLKNFLGALVNGWLAAYSMYHYFEYGELKIWPVMSWVISLIIDSAENYTVILYTLIFMLGSIICGGIAAIID